MLFSLLVVICYLGRVYLPPPHLQLIDYKVDTYNILCRLIIPTIIFSTLIYLPKILFHGGDLEIKQYFIDVFGGVSFWFTSALVVSQLVLKWLMVTSQRSIWFYVTVTGVIFIITSYFINMFPPVGNATDYLPWFYKTGLVYTFIMALGGVYYRYEQRIDKIMKYAWLPILVGYIVIIGTTWGDGTLKLMGLSGRVNPIGFATILCGISLIVIIAKYIPNIKWLTFIGRNSIIFYFFSGVMPAAFGKVASIVSPERTYLVTLLVATLAAIASYILTKFINHYMPFLVDLRKLKK